MSCLNPALPFSVPGIIACMMVLESAAVVIVADSIKQGILIAAVVAVCIASICWIVGIIQTFKEHKWNILGYVMAGLSLFGVIVTGAIGYYWFVNLLPFM